MNFTRVEWMVTESVYVCSKMKCYVKELDCDLEVNVSIILRKIKKRLFNQKKSSTKCTFHEIVTIWHSHSPTKTIFAET